VPDPAAQASPQPQQAPFGSSPVTGPSPNKGYEAAATQQLGLIVQQLTKLVPLVGATSEVGQAVMKALTGLAKHVQPGSNTNASERNAIEKMALQNRQNGEMQQQLRQQQAGGQPGAQQPQPGAQMPPMRSAA